MVNKKRLEIFVASTIDDLKKAREVITQYILQAGHFAVLVENFYASIDSAKLLVEQAIENADIFVLVVGSRIGTLSDNRTHSYIEF